MSTESLGMGACPMGSSPCGFGVPATGDPAEKRILKKVDGTQGDAALIDTTSGDYVLDSSGQKVGWDSLPQQVYLALRTILGSSADPTLGIVPTGGVITDDLAQRNEQAVRAALKRLTDANQILVLSVITTRIGASAVQVETKWQEVRTGAIRSTFV